MATEGSSFFDYFSTTLKCVSLCGNGAAVADLVRVFLAILALF